MLNALETTVCHNVDTISPVQGRDAYTVTCTCGEVKIVEGPVMKEIAVQAKDALKKIKDR